MPAQQPTPVSLNGAASYSVLIGLLGNFLLLKEGQPLAIRQGGKGEALLSHLGIQVRHGVSRTALLQLLWPESDSTLASQALHSLVHSMNKLLSDALNGNAPIIHGGGSYRLNTEAGIAVDVTHFDALTAAGDRHMCRGDRTPAMQAYSSAIDFYRGDLCLGSDIHALIERERLRARYLTLLGHLADYNFDVGNYATCLEYAWRLLACDPCREDAHRLVMQCDVRLGKRAEALHHYRVCTDILRTEFDAAPETATTALFHRIRLEPNRI